MRRDINKEIGIFLKSIEDLWKEEALDGDETEEIAKEILRRLDSINANV